MRAARFLSNSLAPDRIRVRETKCRKDLALARFHDVGLALVLVIVAEKVQHAVNHDVRPVRFERLALLARFASQHRRADHEVTER